MTDDVARTFARYAVSDFASAGGVPDATRKEAERRVLDSIGVAMGALDHPGPAAARRYAAAMAQGSGCRVWGTDLLVSAEVAALVNGAAIRCLDDIDTYFSR